MTAEQQIKSDLAKYFSENNITDIKQGMETLKSLLTPNLLTSCGITEDSPEGVQAWTALQIKEESPLRYHSSEYLGTFIYNSKMYDLKHMDTMGTRVYYLHYKTESGLQPKLPDGIISCKNMFQFCKLPKGFTLGDKFDTSNIIDMSGMFDHCEFPDGFTLGDKFDTSNVTNMFNMFSNCKFPKDFTLENKFDTSNVTDMQRMFRNCDFPEGFALGIKFTITNITDPGDMFDGCHVKGHNDIGEYFGSLPYDQIDEIVEWLKHGVDYVVPRTRFTFSGPWELALSLDSIFSSIKINGHLFDLNTKSIDIYNVPNRKIKMELTYACDTYISFYNSLDNGNAPLGIKQGSSTKIQFTIPEDCHCKMSVDYKPTMSGNCTLCFDYIIQDPRDKGVDLENVEVIEDANSLLQDDTKVDNRIHITPEEIELGKQVANSIQNTKSNMCKLHVIVDDIDGLLSDSDFMLSLGCCFNNNYVTLSEEDKNRWDSLTNLHALCKHSNKSDEEFEVPIGSEISIGDTSMSFTIFNYQGKKIETDCLLFEINGDATLHCVIPSQYSDQLEVKVKQLSGDIKPIRKY